jgi:acylphosphatase
VKAFKIEVSGKVQGVYYRASAKQKAMELGICGTVQNTSNGQVLIVAEGMEEALEQFIIWCKKGPILAKVTQFNVVEIQPNAYSDFKIITS